MLSSFHLIPERHGQTDRQNCYKNWSSQWLPTVGETSIFKIMIDDVTL